MEHLISLAQRQAEVAPRLALWCGGDLPARRRHLRTVPIGRRCLPGSWPVGARGGDRTRIGPDRRPQRRRPDRPRHPEHGLGQRLDPSRQRGRWIRPGRGLAGGERRVARITGTRGRCDRLTQPRFVPGYRRCQQGDRRRLDHARQRNRAVQFPERLARDDRSGTGRDRERRYRRGRRRGPGRRERRVGHSHGSQKRRRRRIFCIERRPRLGQHTEGDLHRLPRWRRKPRSRGGVGRWKRRDPPQQREWDLLRRIRIAGGHRREANRSPL